MLQTLQQFYLSACTVYPSLHFFCVYLKHKHHSRLAVTLMTLIDQLCFLSFSVTVKLNLWTVFSLRMVWWFSVLLTAIRRNTSPLCCTNPFNECSHRSFELRLQYKHVMHTVTLSAWHFNVSVFIAQPTFLFLNPLNTKKKHFKHSFSS